MNPAIGLVVALPVEARALLGRGAWERAEGYLFRRVHFKEGMPLVVVLSGVGRKNAVMATKWLIAKKVRALVSLGMAGGLDPTLQAGDTVFGEVIYQDQGGHYQKVWEGTPGHMRVIRERFRNRGIKGCGGGIVSVKSPALSGSAKKKLHVETGALATDMETGSVAMAAAESSVPFFAFRTICDPADREVGVLFFHCLDADGRIKISRIVPALLRNPLLISDLMILKKDFRSALKGLRHAWHRAIREMIPLLIDREYGEC